MNYNQVLDFLYSQLPMYQRVGAAAYKADLNNTIAICNLIGNPQNNIKSVHIAGTNGKGSVSHLLASAFHEAGYKTGLYTSPHLKDFRERIKINGKIISKQFVKAFVNKYYKDFLFIKPSFFEMTVGLAFDYFAQQKVDIAIIETGLGGRLDSTNVISPELSIITNISYDHMPLLGNTLEKIAFEKSGIIKKNTSVVIGEKQKGINSIFKNAASINNAPIYFAEDIFSVFAKNDFNCLKKTKQYIITHRKTGKETPITCPLLGNYQQKNLLTAFCACQELYHSGYNIDEASVLKGFKNVIKNTGLKGRWQILSRKPLTICDTGHNIAGITENLIQIDNYTYKKLHMVLGVVNDKDLDSILKLFPTHAQYYFCKPAIDRGLDAHMLYEKAKKYNLNGNAYNAVKEALKAAKDNATDKDLIFIGGSTFVVAEVV